MWASAARITLPVNGTFFYLEDAKAEKEREKKDGNVIKKTKIIENEKESILTNDDRKQTKDKNITT